MRRVLDVVRIQTVNWFWVLAFPVLLVLGGLLLIVALTVVAGGAGGTNTGVVTGLAVVLGITHLQTMTQVFPFALGLGVTRRAFFAAAALLVTAQAAGYALLLAVLAGIERATGGWGLGLQMFAVPFLPLGDPPALWLGYAVPLLATGTAGLLLGGLYQRWGQPGVWTVLVAAAVVLVGLAALIGYLGWWPAIGSYLASRSALTLLAGYPLVAALLLGGAGWAVARRATT